MRWLLLDLLVVLLAIGGLVLACLSLWRQVKALGRQLGQAGERVAQLTAQLALVQSPGRVNSGRTSRRSEPLSRPG